MYRDKPPNSNFIEDNISRTIRIEPPHFKVFYDSAHGKKKNNFHVSKVRINF